MQPERLFDRDTRSHEEIYESFRWKIPEEFNIGVAICDTHAGEADRTALLTESAQAIRPATRSPT